MENRKKIFSRKRVISCGQCLHFMNSRRLVILNFSSILTFSRKRIFLCGNSLRRLHGDIRWDTELLLVFVKISTAIYIFHTDNINLIISNSFIYYFNIFFLTFIGKSFVIIFTVEARFENIYYRFEYSKRVTKVSIIVFRYIINVY